MTVSKKQRRTQIPEEAIEGAAGINDDVIFTGYTVGICCEKEVKKPNKENTRTKIEDSKEPKEVCSTDLGFGMNIPVKSGGRGITHSQDDGIEAR